MKKARGYENIEEEPIDHEILSILSHQEGTSQFNFILKIEHELAAFMKSSR